jgi:protocatechuate 3,4-dioxygenase beta subunit
VDELLTRRSTLVRLGGLVAASLGLRAAEPDDSLAGVASGVVKCVLTPEQTEGPYYLAGEKLRRDIREGHRGAPLLLRLTVVDASTCKPVQGATVEVWHCDAAGNYSGFGGDSASRTFLRGGQKTNANGVATIQTIYPGWYPGRTVHIHVKVHVRGNVVHTGQIYFNDAVTDAVYRKAPYTSRPNRTTRNANDSIWINGGSRSQMAIKKSGGGYVGTLVMGVTR